MLTVSGGIYQGPPAESSCNNLEFEGDLDFLALELDERGLRITVSAMIGQGTGSLGIPDLAYQPTRKFGAEPEEGKLKH